MTASDKSTDDLPGEPSIPTGAVPLETILCTEELALRPSRLPQYEKETRALAALSGALAHSPGTVLQTLAEAILEVTQCDSSGVSLLTSDGKRFQWSAVAGRWTPYIGGGSSRNFGPCGDVLDRNTPLLMRHWERRYTYLSPISPPVEEALVVPWYVGGKAIGTIWAVMHDLRRKFDAEDERLLTSIGKFSSTAYQALASIDELRLHIREREKAEVALRELASGLDTQVRVRTQELERSRRELLATNNALEREIAERKHAIDARARTEIQLDGENQLLEMLAGGHSMSEILEAICRLAERTAAGCYCSVVLVDPSGTHLEHGAAPSLPATFIGSIIGRPVGIDSGPCAMAAHLNEQVIAADLTTETRWAAWGWCPMAMAHGLQACWSTPITSTDGEVLGAFAIYYDEPRTPTSHLQSMIAQFTHIARIAIERVKSDIALRRSEAFLAEGQRLSSTGSFCWRVTTDEITWSEQTYRIFDFDRALPVTLELIASRIHPDDAPLFHDVVERARAGGGDFEYEQRLQMPDQTLKYLRVVAHATRDPDGQLEYIGAVQDVTQRRLSEEVVSKARSDLARVARATSLGVLAASIAHELNQPLSGIITNASTCLRMLNADRPNVDGARETARRTIRDGNRAADVITRLRALFNKRDITKESVDLNETAREVISLSLSELQRNRVVLQLQLADDLPPVTADRVQLQQVILNLLRNASEAMSGIDDRPRQLVLRTDRDEGDRVRLAVQDVGVGLDPQAGDRLFTAFHTTKSEGMGIGLSVSRSIVESHDGRLWAAPNDGPGATFAFSIPCAIGAMSNAYDTAAETFPPAQEFLALHVPAERRRASL